jgi:type I restriction enzyme S subunit
VRFNPKICNPDFAYYVLSSNKFQTILKNLNIGAAQPSIRVPHFINQSILIPSLEEQGKIADILGTLDDKIELNRQMNQTLEAMARAIFKSWFVDFDPVYAKMEGRDYPLPPEIMDLFPDELEESELGLIPKGWRVGGLGEIIEIHDSKRIPLSKKERSERKGKFPYYGATKIVDFVDDYLFDGVFLLVGEDGSVINDEGYPFLQYVWGQFWANNHAHVLNGKNGFSTEYVYLLLKKTNISPFITGAVQLKLNQENMKSIPIILPPQNMLIHFSNEINEYFSKIKNNDEQIEILTRLRELLLPKLINGLLEI